MGSCLSTNPPPHATSPSDHVGPTSSSSSSFLSSGSKRWKKNKKQKEKTIEEQEKDELFGVPGRMFVNGCSEVACLFTQQGKKGTNQDAMIVWENFTLRSDTVFCGVFDGHGPYGHMVARKVRDSLPIKLCNEWKTITSGHDSPYLNGSRSGSMNSEESATISIDGEWSESLDPDQNLPDMYPLLKQSLLKAFKLMDKELKFHPVIDCFCSGSTAVTVIKQGQDLVIGNVGDSRAILGTRDKDNNLVAVQLTVDLKPNLPREAARIHQCNGRVFALQDEPEVARVWLPNSDSPGLAMARAFGDFCLKEYGLISVPDISYRRLTEKDEFIVLATDGTRCLKHILGLTLWSTNLLIWDVLSNKEVVDKIASAPTRSTAARALVECAVRSWRLKYPTSKIDDCAVVCLFLDSGKIFTEQLRETVVTNETSSVERDGQIKEGSQNNTSAFEYSRTLHNHDNDEDEILPVSEEPTIEKMPGRSESTRSLADCITNTEEEEWSALEGVTRVNSLLNIPRFLTKDKWSSSRRKWL